MPTHVVESAQVPSEVPNDDNGLSGNLAGQPVAGLSDTVLVPDILPGSGEHCLQVQSVKSLFREPARWYRLCSRQRLCVQQIGLEVDEIFWTCHRTFRTWLLRAAAIAEMLTGTGTDHTPGATAVGS